MAVPSGDLAPSACAHPIADGAVCRCGADHASAWFSAPLRWLAHAVPCPLEPTGPERHRCCGNQSATMQSLACFATIGRRGALRRAAGGIVGRTSHTPWSTANKAERTVILRHRQSPEHGTAETRGRPLPSTAAFPRPPFWPLRYDPTAADKIVLRTSSGARASHRRGLLPAGARARPNAEPRRVVPRSFSALLDDRWRQSGLRQLGHRDLDLGWVEVDLACRASR